ncbi:MAG: amidohydrolase family protein [Desulfuromusa sp.]|nr:amidohydrolase family protein [Desulfuromusa sp.]
MKKFNQFKIFDSHFHIIDKRFPLVANHDYLPDNFSATDYLARTKSYDIAGGAIVSGSFQVFDQAYLLSALAELGPAFVGVTQLPATVTDAELISLNKAGIRAVRFNLKRGGSEGIRNLERFSRRIYETVGWHTELYVDAKDLPELHDTLIKLPSVCIDHLGLSKAGFPNLLALVEKGIFVKATGFSRVDFDVRLAIREIVTINPAALIFGTDLPSTRAPQPYSDNDYSMVIETLGEDLARQVFYENALNLYRPAKLTFDDNS